MKKIISIFCVVLVVFCMMNVFEEKPQAAFFIDDALIASVIADVLLSVALSEGIAIATGGESIYTSVANALWEYFISGEAAGDVDEAINKMRLYGSFVYQSGKFYFALNQNGYNFFRSWLTGIDFDSIHADANISYSGLDFPAYESILSNFSGQYAIGEVNQVISLNHLGYTATYLPTGIFTVTLNNDGTVIYQKNISFNSNVKVLVLYPANQNGDIQLYAGCKSSGGYTVPADNVRETDRTSSSFGSASCSLWITKTSNSYCAFDGSTYSLKNAGSYPSFSVKLDDTTIAVTNNIGDYRKKVWTAGCLLTNRQNNVSDINSNNGLTSAEIPVEFEEVAPAIPNNNGIGRNQVALIPVPGNTVDAENQSIVLSPGEVKQYDREGKDYTFIPVPSQLQGKTGADLGVTVMNETTFEETSNPVYVPNYPDVFPTASPDVTITAGADVFPTVAPTEAPTAGEGSTADAIAGDIADIKDEIGDLSTPLTPPQAQDGTNKLRLPTLLLQKFPFCIPYDFYNGINQFKGEAETPQFDIPFEWEFFGRQLSYNIHIDFSSMTTLAKICQWFFSVAWVVALILLTRKVVWK